MSLSAESGRRKEAKEQRGNKNVNRQAAEAQSQESLRILQNRYEAGLATMTDLLSAEAVRSAARAALAEAIYRHRLSYAQVEYAAGILAPGSPAVMR